VASRLKPGSHIAALCPVLEHHRITQGIEDVGFEIRDCIMFLGNPKLMITLARLPLEASVAQNVLRYGTGAISIGSCRVPVDAKADASQLRTINRNVRDKGDGWGLSTLENTRPQVLKEEGRWPTNVIIQDDEAIRAKFPFSKSCNSPSSAKPESKYRPGQGNYQPQGRIYPGDSGSAARFFHTVTEDNRLLELMSYMCKLCTPPQGKALVVGLGNDAIIGLESLGFNVFQYSSNE
jgi:site-specific DNA-methyltransferase (adenine-specific)